MSATAAEYAKMVERKKSLPATWTCRECGKRESGAKWMASCAVTLHDRRECFTCNHWIGLIERAAEGRSVIVDGTHYMLGDELAGPFMRGFGGSRFRIIFSDGHLATSTNLWCQGRIPDRFRERLPDNATFEATPT